MTGNSSIGDGTVVAHRNGLTGIASFGVNNLNPFRVEATCNWWDAKNGPGPVGPGSGDKVRPNVTFAPWLKSSNLRSSCKGSGNGDEGDDNDQGATGDYASFRGM